MHHIDNTKIITEGKPRYSQVLQQDRNWTRPSEKLPEENSPVVLRLMHSTELGGEDESYLYPIEDIMVGYYSSGHWVIASPFPKYDYSRLSNKSVINENVEVTHWADLNEGELEGWKTRFNRIREYGKLVLEVDEDSEEDVYRALMWAGHFIAMAAGPDFYNKDSDMRKWYEILCDLQNAIEGNNNGNV